MSNFWEVGTTVAEISGPHARFHRQMTRMAYRVNLWMGPDTGVDWASAGADSREEIARARAELIAAGYLDADNNLTALCGDYGTEDAELDVPAVALGIGQGGAG